MKFDSHHFAFLAVLLVSSVSIFTLLSLDNSITGNFGYGIVGAGGRCSGESGQFGEQYSCLPGLTCYRQDQGAVEGVCQGTPTPTVCGNNIKEYNELCDPAGSACTINGGQGTCSNDCKTCNPQQQTAISSTISTQPTKGVLTMSTLPLPQNTVNAGTNNVVIGRYSLVYSGQNVIRDTLDQTAMFFQFSGGIELNNVRVLVDGVLRSQKPNIPSASGSYGFSFSPYLQIKVGQTKTVDVIADLPGSTQQINYQTIIGKSIDPSFDTNYIATPNTLTINPGSPAVATPPSILVEGVALPPQPNGVPVEIARFNVKALNVPTGTNKIEAKDMGIRFTWPSVPQGNTIITGLNDLAVYYDGSFMSAFSMNSVQNNLVQQAFSPPIYIYSDQTKTISVRAYPIFQGTYTTELIRLEGITISGTTKSSITIQQSGGLVSPTLTPGSFDIGHTWNTGTNELHQIIGPELAFDCQKSNLGLTGVISGGGGSITFNSECKYSQYYNTHQWITYPECHVIRQTLLPGTNVIKDSFWVAERVTKTCASGQVCVDPKVGCAAPTTTSQSSTGTTSSTPLASTSSATTSSSACPGGSAVYGPDPNDGLVTAENCRTENVGFFGSSVFVEGKGPANADGSLNTCNSNTLKKYFCGNVISGTSKSQVCSRDISCSSLGGTCAVRQYQGSNYGVCVDPSGKEIQISGSSPSATTAQAVSNCKKVFQDFYARYPLRAKFTEGGKWLDAPAQQPTRITFFYPGPDVTSYNNQNLKVKVFSQSGALLGEYNAEGSIQDGSKPKTLVAGVGMVTTVITSLPQSVLKLQLFTTGNEECSDTVTVNIPSSLVPAPQTTSSTTQSSQTSTSTNAQTITQSVSPVAQQQVASVRPSVPSMPVSVPSISPQQISSSIPSVSTPQISRATRAAGPVSTGVAPTISKKSASSQPTTASASPSIDVSSYAAAKISTAPKASQTGKTDVTVSQDVETAQVYPYEVESGKELVLKFRDDPSKSMIQVKVKTDKNSAKTFYAVNKGEGVFELKVTPVKVEK